MTVWMLDLSTLKWELVFALDETNSSTSSVNKVTPEPRYFHTANNYKNEVILIFGGLSPSTEDGGGERCIDNLAIFDLSKREWHIPKFEEETSVPTKRYAHVATVCRDRLVIAGGETRGHGRKSSPEPLLDIHVFDILSEKWVHSRPFGTKEDPIGYYRSVMATAAYHPQNYPIYNTEEEDRLLDTAETLYQQLPAARLNSEPSSPTMSFRSRSGSVESTHSPEDRRPSRGNLNAIPETESSELEPYLYVYSTRQRSARDITRLLYKVHSPHIDNFAIEDLSSRLPQRGGNIPLKFPFGDIVGDWLLFCGTIPNQKPVDVPGRPRPAGPAQLKPAAFHILAMHIPTQQFKVIDVGNVFLTGSWNRGIVWAEKNLFVVFGSVTQDMNTDYAMRRSNFNHVVFVDLEVFGIYDPPRLRTASFARAFAMEMLNNKRYSDMDIATKDHQRIAVNTRILAHRWPLFSEVLNDCVFGNASAGEEMGRRPSIASILTPQNQHPGMPVADRPRVLYLPLNADHTWAFLTYLYTDALPTSIDVPTLCAMLVLSKRYAPGLERLAALTCDVLHRQLNEGNAWQIIEAAAFAGQTGLQVQAMLVMTTAADLKAQAQRKRAELRKKQSLPALPNGETNGSGGSIASIQSVEGSIIPSSSATSVSS
jgi:leucine-zipper-like transcriptional regulator 1